MAENFEMTPAELRSTASVFRDKAEEMTGIINDMYEQVNSLESGWDGAAQDAFFDTYNEMQDPMKQFPEILTQISEALISFADAVEETDESIAQQMKN